MIKWTVDNDFLHSPAITNRNLFAEVLAIQSDEAIVTHYAGLTSEQIDKDFSQIFNIVRVLGIKLEGTGLELGAGVGILSAAVVKQWPNVNQCYAVEIVPKVIELLQQRAVSYIARENADKVLGVLGSFDDMPIQDNFFDFCIEYASLHHSNNLLKTLRETARVLKPGAPMIAIDRAHNDGVSDEQLQFMLDVQYSEEWKRRNGYAKGPLSRAENGEHEIRMREWLTTFATAGFEVVKRIELRPNGLQQLLYKAKLILPFFLRRALDLHPSRVSPRWMEIVWLLGGSCYSQNYLPATKEHTLFIARKCL